jgi:hypothetical protein
MVSACTGFTECNKFNSIQRFDSTAESLLQMDAAGVPDMDTMVSMLPESMQERGGKMIEACKTISEYLDLWCQWT